MKKEKGFTIMELLGVLAIIAILALIIVPGVTKYIQKGKDTYNDGVKKQLVLAAKNRYSESNVSEIKNNVYDYVTAGELSTEGYLKEELVDSEGQSCTKDSYVVTKYTKTLTESGIKELKYYPCMKCGETTYMTEKEAKQCHKYKIIPYNTEGYPVCDIDRTYNRAIQTKLTITKNKVNEKNIVVEKITDDSFTEELETKLTEEEQGKSTITDKVHKFPWGNDKFKVYLIDTNDKYLIECGDPVPSKVPGEIKAKMYYVATDKFVNENNKPSKEDMVEYDGTTWEDGYVYVEIENFDEYDYMTLGNSDERITTSWFWITKEGAVTTKVVGHYEALSSDKTKVESKTKEKEFNTKLDRTAPTCALTLKKGSSSGNNYTSGSWYTSSVFTSAICNDGDKGSGCNTNEVVLSGATTGTHKQNTYTVSNEGTTTANWSVSDKVGHKTNCNKATIKIDKTDPTITYALNKSATDGGWYKTSDDSPLTITATCTDTGGSKLVTKLSLAHPNPSKYNPKVSTSDAGSASLTASWNRTAAGNGITYKATCVDKSGRTSNKDKKIYVKVYSADNSCDCDTYKRCSKCDCKEYNKTTCTGTRWKCIAPTSSAGATYEYSSCKVGNTKTTTGSVRTCTCQSYSYSCNGSCKTYKRCSKCTCETYKKCWHY